MNWKKLGWQFKWREIEEKIKYQGMLARPMVLCQQLPLLNFSMHFVHDNDCSLECMHISFLVCFRLSGDDRFVFVMRCKCNRDLVVLRCKCNRDRCC
ncbi:hypothetical protein DAI22_02g171700 [Oryza sativa Japonica Group]|nr:hypothetical protein DAI22_02g171700 [Oryza sativa Japonica Group]